MWQVEFYELPDETQPVQEFLDSLDAKRRAKSLRDIGVLSEFGNTLREPYTKNLEDGVFELRTILGTDVSRIFFFFFVGRRIILTHGCTKKSNNTPPGEIERAKKYKADFERRAQHDKL